MKQLEADDTIDLSVIRVQLSKFRGSLAERAGQRNESNSTAKRRSNGIANEAPTTAPMSLSRQSVWHRTPPY